MSRRRSKKSSLRGEIIYRLSGLAAVGAFVGSVYLFPDSGSNVLIYGAILSTVALLGTALVLSLLLRPRAKIEATFDFSDPPPGKHKQASEFEYEVAGLIHSLTGKRTEVVGGSGDGGIDIKVYADDGHLTGIVQCKRIASNKMVYPAYIRDLNTVRHHHQVQSAYLVSTGRFSADSQELARKLGVKLIDGEALKRLRKKALRSAN